MIELISSILEGPQVYALTMTLVHSLWQAVLIGAVLKVLLNLYGRSFIRYALGILASLVVVASSIYTYGLYVGINGSTDLGIIETVTISTPRTMAIDMEYTATSLLARWSPGIFAAWFIGVLLHFCNILFSIGYLQYLKQGQLNERLTVMLSEVKKKLNISDKVQILESAKASAPYTFGFVKPVILFPLGLVNMLTAEEVEAIIVHELTHIARRDYLINVLQTIVEAIYFFNPALRWIHKVIREERESICDEAAIIAGISPMTYARTLVKLEEARQSNAAALALAFTNDKHQLINRIKRIMNTSQTSRTMKVKSLVTVFMMAVAIVFSASILTGNSSPSTDDVESLIPTIMKIDDLRSGVQTIDNILPQIDTLPQSKSSISIHTKTDGQEMSLTKENGKITSLIIDGKVIPESEYENYSHLTEDLKISESSDGRSMMFFGDGEGFENLDFEEIFDSEQMKEMMKSFKNLEGHDFAFPEMKRFEMLKEPFLEFDAEQMESFQKEMEELGSKLQMEEGQMQGLQQMMENLGGQFEHMRIDTIFEFDLDNNSEVDPRFHFFLDENEEGAIEWNNDNFGSNNSGRLADVLGAELNRDGLLEPFKENRVELTGKYLKINGDKQPKNIWGKYKRIYEEQTGMLMTKKARVDFNVEGKKSNRRIRSF